MYFKDRNDNSKTELLYSLLKIKDYWCFNMAQTHPFVGTFARLAFMVYALAL